MNTLAAFTFLKTYCRIEFFQFIHKTYDLKKKLSKTLEFVQKLTDLRQNTGCPQSPVKCPHEMGLL